ncbi:MAG: hypothetical protein AAGC60_08415 [Acidobacteriota bacterium]
MCRGSNRRSVSPAQRLSGWALQAFGGLLFAVGFGLSLTLLGACATPLLLLLGVLCFAGGAFVRNPPPAPQPPSPRGGGGGGGGERVLPWRPHGEASTVVDGDRLAA